jgi:uncharacterized protein
MSDIRIVNCHVHLFTDRHIPRRFPNRVLSLLSHVPGLIRFLAFATRLFGQSSLSQFLDRVYQLRMESRVGRQADVLERLLPQYPENTRFVILPLDLAGAGYGRVPEGIRAQHDELARLAADPRYKAQVVPFANCDPRQPGAAEEVRRCISELGFRGLKLYPRLGFDPDHPVLMNDVYPLLVERNLPVVTHCSRGAVIGKGIVPAVGDAYSSPEAFARVLRTFPGLRVNLAHFGGERDWNAYVKDGIRHGDPDAERKNWQVLIRRMITSGEFPNLWTDISYTLFHFEELIPFLQLFLEDDRVAKRVLFGSDFYMTRLEALSERAVCFRLRAALGEKLFHQIAAINPRVWLGEVTL